MEKEADTYKYINRRNIYFHRLVGDDSFHRKDGSFRDPLYYGFIYLFYTFLFIYLVQ